MAKRKTNIVSSISKTTGSSESDTNRIITEFVRTLRDAASNKRTIVVPGIGPVTLSSSEDQSEDTGLVRIPDATQWYDTDDDQPETVHSTQDKYQSVLYPVMPKFRILNELHSNRGSDVIIDRFLKLSRIPKKVLAEKVLEISPKTLNSYCVPGKKLPTRLKEQLLKLETLYEKGIELLEDAGGFNDWLRSDSYGLGNEKPLSLLNSITGIDMVVEELIRIEFGTTA